MGWAGRAGLGWAGPGWATLAGLGWRLSRPRPGGRPEPLQEGLGYYLLIGVRLGFGAYALLIIMPCVPMINMSMEMPYGEYHKRG